MSKRDKLLQARNKVYHAQQEDTDDDDFRQKQHTNAAKALTQKKFTNEQKEQQTVESKTNEMKSYMSQQRNQIEHQRKQVTKPWERCDLNDPNVLDDEDCMDVVKQHRMARKVTVMPHRQQVRDT